MSAAARAARAAAPPLVLLVVVVLVLLFLPRMLPELADQLAAALRRLWDRIRYWDWSLGTGGDPGPSGRPTVTIGEVQNPVPLPAGGGSGKAPDKRQMWDFVVRNHGGVIATIRDKSSGAWAGYLGADGYNSSTALYLDLSAVWALVGTRGIRELTDQYVTAGDGSRYPTPAAVRAQL